MATTTPTVPSTRSSSRAASSRTVFASPPRTTEKRGSTPVERTADGDVEPGMANASTRAASSAISAGLR
jgi:hypothetical protein